jgi:two-component system, OmpR family, response regulator RegX3
LQVQLSLALTIVYPENAAAMRILHLDDHPLQLDLARAWLEPQGHELVSVTTGGEAIAAMQDSGPFDLVILDWMVPGMSGEEVLRWIRERDQRVPVMFATSNEDEAEIVHILDLGADDYLTKPLRRMEFLARVNALLRRAAPAGPTPAGELQPYQLDRATRTVLLQGNTVRMSARMNDLAFHLFDRRGQIVSRREIFKQVWGYSRELESRTVDTFVSRLRTALELDGRHGWRIVSVYQHGYRLEKIE